MATEVTSELDIRGFRTTAAYRTYVLAVLILAGACAWIDRHVFAIILQVRSASYG